jgi:rSAM/selenodomain-associated transferase 1
VPAPSPTLLLFTKPARPGRVKTRLIGDLTAQEAARLHEAFVLDLFDRLGGAVGSAARPFEVRVAWALEEGEPIPEAPFPGERQEGSDLGARLYSALSRAARGGGAVAALGTDYPTLPLERIEEAFARLEAGADAVVGPAFDGGYYLIALRPEAVLARLFEGISWSTHVVLAQTVDRCRELGLSLDLLPPGADVDTPDDLSKLARELVADDRGCPRTRRLLAAWGRLPAVGRGGAPEARV